MAIPKKIIQFFDKAKVKYDVIRHRTVYTAYDKAQTLKVSQRIIGKTLVLRVDNRVALVLIPANKNLDKGKFKKIAKVKQMDFVNEVWMKKNLKGTKIGAIPPFGNLWRLPTFIEKSLLKEPRIIVNGGDYNWSIKINPTSLKKLIPDLTVGYFAKIKK